jgi:type I restriction enzyme S subunit
VKNEQRKMKNSGIEWIGEIPNNWTVKHVKNLFYVSKTKAFIKDPIVLSLARSGVKVRDISNNEGQLAESYEEYNSVIPGDLLLNPMDLYSGANCSMSEVSGVISPAYINLRANDNNVNPKFYDYYFKVQYWSMAMFAHGKGVSYDNRWTINRETVLNYYLPYISVDEQNSIVELLNNKLLKINEMIDVENQQIEKLKEYKQSIITEAVTKGLDKNVEMKDSGVEWIGKIPKNWQVIKLKYAYISVEEKYNSGEYPYIALENIESKSGNYVQTETNKNYSLDGTIIADKNAVVFGKLRPYLAKAFLITEPSCVSSEFAVFVSNCNSTEYLKYLFLSNNFIDWVNSSTYGTKMPRANIDFIRNTYIAIPNIKEQNNIVNFIKTKNKKIDDIINVKKTKIEKLNEYKKSLIYEYVTGKKEV